MIANASGFDESNPQFAEKYCRLGLVVLFVADSWR